MKKKARRPTARQEAPFFRPFAGVASVAKPTNNTRTPYPAPPPPSPTDVTFEQLLYGVERLPRAAKTPSAPTGASPDAQHEEAMARLRRLVEGGDGRFELSDDGRRIEGRRVDVDVSLARRLRRGELPIDGTLDLHGLDAVAAREALERRIADAAARGERTLLVSHGKGHRSPGGHGVLRGEIGAWLSQGRERARVAAFCTALAEDGGDGALYVRLR